MANVEWLIAGGLVALGLAIGFGIGLFISRKTGKVRDLQHQLESTQSELDGYREQVVTQFSETAQKFKNLNDAYVDLHQQLANSASALCGNATGPLLEAPGRVENLIAAETADESSTESSTEPSTEPSTDSSAEADAETSGETLAQADAGNEILVPEPSPAGPSGTDEPPSAAEPTEPRKYSAGS